MSKPKRYLVKTFLILALLAAAAGAGYYYHQPERVTYQVDVPIELDTTKIILYLNPKVDPQVAGIIAQAIDESATKYRLPKNLVACVAYRESGFATLAVSSSDCVGIMQINPIPHADKIKKRRLTGEQVYWIKNNVDLGCEILAENLVYTKGDLTKALNRYVGGHPTYVQDVFASLGKVTAELK